MIVFIIFMNEIYRKSAQISVFTVGLLLILALPIAAQTANPGEASASLAAPPTSAPTATDGGDVTSLSAVVVTGTRLDLDQLQTPITITSVDRDEFEDSGALSFQDTVDRVPGLQVGAQGGVFLRFATRGFRSTNDVLVMIDGVPFRQVNGNADLINIPIGLVENLEYAKGPGSSVYGRDAVAGVVNIFTDVPRTDVTSGEVSVNGGSFGTYDAYVRAVVPTADNGAVNVDFGDGWSNGYEVRTANDDQFAKISDDQQLTPNLDLRESYIDTHFFAYRSGAYPLLNGDIAYGLSPTANLAVPDTFYKAGFQSFTVTPTLTLGSEWKVTAITNYNRFLRNYIGGIAVDTNPGYNQNNFFQASVQDILYEDIDATWTHKFGDVKNTFLVGVTYENGHFTQNAATVSNQPTFTAPNFGVPVTNAQNYPYGVIGPNVQTWIYQPVTSGYVEERAELGDFSLLLGARYDQASQSFTNSSLTQYGQQTVSAISPRASLTDQFYNGASDQASVFVSFSKSFKPLAPSSSTSGGVTVFELLHPEIADSYELGFKGYDDNRRIFWYASIYQIEKVNAQVFYRINTLNYLITQDEQRARGFESQVEFRTTKWLDFYLDYAYNDAVNVKYVTPTLNLSDNQIAMNPRSTAGAGADLTSGAWGLDVNSNFTGTRPLRDDILNSQILPSYLITNAVLSYNYKRTTFQLGVDNIGNIVYISDNLSGDNNGSTGEPRSFFGKVIYRF
jgi:outer membrane receptor protein involved in Fe transport